MKQLLTLVTVLAFFVAFTGLALAQPGSVAGTLYQQEGTPADGPAGIDASGQGPAGNDSDNWTNWKYQYGGGSWSGVYAGANAWLTADSTGDMNLEVEADIEMYFTQTISNNKVYFHIGNLYSALSNPSDLIAYVPGSFSSNNGQYIGISFLGTGKDSNSFEKVGGLFTGRIIDGMVSDRDTWRSQSNSMDVEILLSWGSGWQVPVAYGDGAHNTVHDTLWWLVGGGAPGTYNYNWRIRLLPDAHQPDGDYALDPVVVAAPVL